MRILAMPRLDASVARQLLLDRWKLSVADARAAAATSHPRQKFASNGERMSPDAIGQLVDELRQAASDRGYPLRSPNETEARAWDSAATEITWKYLRDLVIAEAGRSDVWAFLTVIACPDLVIWRYAVVAGDTLPTGVEARFFGGRRNLLKRFWQRGRALAAVGADWSVLNQLREDDLVQVFERPSLSAVPRLAGRLLTRLAASTEDVSARDILKRLNRELAVTAMYCMPESELDGVVLDKVDASKTAVARSKTKTR